ncbi:MAG: ribosome recycling factor [Dehalococcoidia bacterium]
MVQESIQDSRERMLKALDSLHHDLATVRTGRASPGLVEHLRADYYGTPTALNQMATITTPEARLIVIQPWDRTGLSAIEKAIQKSDLGLNPTNDGSVIRLAIPPLTEDRRRDLVKQVHKRVEECRIAVRNVRRDCHERIRRLEHDHEISEDELRRAETNLQNLTDEQVKQIDKVGEEKEAELLAI